MKYNVHIYAIVRVEVKGVEANSAEEAATIADTNTDLHAAVKDGEYAESVEGYLVDALDGKGEIVGSGININADFSREEKGRLMD